MKKILKEIERLYSKITDRLFLTENFHKYQIKYSKIYSNNYKLEKNQYSFVHAPKTAGTSISTFLKKNNIFIFDSVHNLVSKNCDPKNYKYITTIRNPIDRTKSFYEMQLNNKKLSFHHHSKKGLSIFLTKLKINQNCLCKFIIGDLNTDIDDSLYKKAENNLRNFWYIIDFENLDEDIEKLANKLDINSGLEHLGKKTKENKLILSSEELSLISKYNKFDLKLFEFFKNNLKN